MKYTLKVVGAWFDSIRTHYLDYENKQNARYRHDNHTADEPGDPVYSVTEPHHFHHFFQPLFLLVHDALDNVCNSVDPCHYHEQWKTTCNGIGESEIVYKLNYKQVYNQKSKTKKMNWVGVIVSNYNSSEFRHIITFVQTWVWCSTYKS